MLAARSGDQLKVLAERLRSAHQIDATALIVDLRKPEDIARLVKEAAEVDILVNNAGDIPGGSIEKIDEPTWRHAWELKVFGYINITRAIYAQMKARGHGVIVNDIGVAGEKIRRQLYLRQHRQCRADGVQPARSAARASPTTFASSASIPGRSAPTAMSRCSRPAPKHQFGDESRYKEFQKVLPLGRPAHAREIGDLMAFLASDRSGLYLGRDLHGGWRD